MTFTLTFTLGAQASSLAPILLKENLNETVRTQR